MANRQFICKNLLHDLMKYVKISNLNGLYKKMQMNFQIPHEAVRKVGLHANNGGQSHCACVKIVKIKYQIMLILLHLHYFSDV